MGNPRHLTYKITELTDKIYKREREMAKKRECMCDDDRSGDTELIDTSDSAVWHIKLNTCQLWYILPLILNTVLQARNKLNKGK